jgi:dTDP-L-rhamnose 4-epimerase
VRKAGSEAITRVLAGAPRHAMSERARTEGVLITGGAGFIGTALATRLVQRGERVIVVDSFHPQVHPRGSGARRRLPPEISLIPSDVTVSANWDALLMVERPRVVVHLAAETGTEQSLLEATRHARTNVVGTTAMLDAFARWECPPDHIVLASSRAVYGEGEWSANGTRYRPGPRLHDDLEQGRFDPRAPDGGTPVPVPHAAASTVPDPSSVYGATKLAQEHVLRAWSGAMGTRLSILRLQNVYGAGQSLSNAYTGVLTLFARLATLRRPSEVYEDGEIIRDFVHVDDVVSAFVRAIDRPPEYRRLLDIGSGSPTTIAAVAGTLARLAGAPAPAISGRFRDGDVRAASCDSAPAALELGFSASVPLEDGLRSLLDWVRGVLDMEPA